MTTPVAEPPVQAVPDEPEVDENLAVQGSGSQLTFDVGGKAPTTSAFRLTGGEIQVEGQFAKGETISLLVEAQVGEVAFRDERDDKTGQVVGAKRVHKARIVGVQKG